MNTSITIFLEDRKVFISKENTKEYHETGSTSFTQNGVDYIYYYDEFSNCNRLIDNTNNIAKTLWHD